MTKAKTKRFLMKAALGASLAAGVSLFPLMRHIVGRQTADFDKIRVTVGTDTVSKQQFFERLSYRDGAWRFAASDGTFVNVDSLADFRTKDALLHEYFCKLKLKNSVDTVYVRYAMGSQKKYMSDIVYGMGAKDSLGYLPSFGRYNYDRLNLRYFKADSEELQKVVDVYNDKYNCTYRHEYQHYLNAVSGIGRAGQSYENKFVECCLDEVSANIAQLLEQRKHYLESGRDLSFFTSRFKFYREAVESGKVKPAAGIYSKKEVELIAGGVFDAWMAEKFNLYVRNNTARTVHILSKTNYNGVQPDSVRHRRLMRACFNINGVDFYPYIARREAEIKAKIPNDKLKLFRLLKKEKFKEMGYLEKLEKMRIEEGERDYNVTLAKNKLWAHAKKLLGGSSR